MMPGDPLRALAAVASTLLCASCVSSAGSVHVPTMSMREALALTRNDDALPAVPAAARERERGTSPPALVAPPEVRMAWLYEWVDDAGNRHFGGWVAIPLRGFGWVMGDGTEEAIDRRDLSPGDAP
jgi:hypothetical protein